MADTFALESELAETIVAQLKAKLSPEEKAAIEEESTSDPLAHDLFLEANVLITMPLFNVQGTQNLFEAADLLEKAVARDPNYFQAYCKLASVHDQIYLMGPIRRRPDSRWPMPPSKRRNGSARRGETHLALAEHLYCGFLDYDRARHELELPGVPCLTSHWFLSWPALSIAVRVTGMHRRAISCALWNSTRAIPIRCNNSRPVIITCAITRTKQRFWTVHWRSCLTMPACGSSGLEFPCIDALTRSRSTPRSTRSWPKLGGCLGTRRRMALSCLCERDATGLDRALAAMPSTGYSNAGFVFPRSWCEAIAARMVGRDEGARVAFAAARKEVERTLRDRPDYGQSLSLLGMIDAGLGRKEEAIRKAVARWNCSRSTRIDQRCARDRIPGRDLCVDGRNGVALEQLKYAATIPSDVSYGQLRLHPFWDSLRGDPRFDEIVSSLAPTAGSR